ncbi:RagB/SusD family nutrient uptake outer membrane protein [Mucilaginibacter paludis]|uniref:RagB/SusD domain-containing protein n=1 Tax=Mucilaginibacter paludis DSM 18603 TaxID=714943 RepID=H1Y4F3_9SPHI|nr:RagB/SusD family nutrient uptake outer membrane protein [Mucilaginibacter paludis]EHQ25787.1 RagB/SusD domain-containing protein [Mucilaginibacter paludis DSM 18603]
MKKHNILVIATVMLISITTSCKKGYLDQVPNDRLTLDATFNNSTTAVEFLANTYSYLPDEANQQNAPGSNAGVWTGGSSEAEYDWGFVASQNINNGAYDASSSFVSAYWNNYYQGIRSATIFIANIDKVPNLSANLKTQYKAEAKALRAIYYFYLMRIYGPLILLGEQTLAPDAAISTYQLSRSSIDDCVTYISNELDAAAKDLPAKPSNSNTYGRITSGFAQAIKSEALLYAASPLFNGNTDYSTLVNKDGTHLISQTVDVTKWAKAAAATKAFIDTYVPNTYNLYQENDNNGNYSAYLSCRDVMLVDWNSEVIYANTNPNVTTWQYDTTPYHQGFPGEVQGAGSLGATQEMVDAFFMANGKPITDPTSGYMQSGFQNFAAVNQDFPTYTYNQWIGREARFYVDITYNNSEWLDKNAGLFITDLTYHGNSGRNAGQNDYCPTGYIVRKNNPPSDRTQGNRTFVMLRLAEIYLNYAEALNESDPGNPDILKYVNLIRTRAGIPAYGQGVDAPAGQDAVRQAIRRERQIELAFENNRFFDVRRWKIATQTEAGALHGLNINADAPDFYNVVTFETRVFNKKSYLFPIPQTDVNSDTQIVQNTGW